MPPSSLANATSDLDVYHQFPDVPTAENFVRRAYHASLVLGDYIYIDGGEIRMYPDGQEPYLTMPNNDTLFIDLTFSFSPDTVEFQAVNKTNAMGLYILNDQFLFPSADNDSFFAFGGEVPWLRNGVTVAPTSVAQFTLNGNQGSGSWADFDPGPTSGFEDIVRPSLSLHAVVDNTLFAFGGTVNSHSSTATMFFNGGDSFPLPGIVAWNMTSGTWKNTSLPSHLVRPNGRNGIATGVTNFGPSGLVLAAGMGTVDDAPPNFENITIYEPIGQTWHYQKATGDIPEGRGGACAVGIQGDNGTYEIFVHGGRHNQGGGELTSLQVAQNRKLDEVFVLSLPAFTWFKYDYPSDYPRYYHTCNAIGNRYLLSIGGKSSLDDGKDDTKDHLTHGLGILDLTEMMWVENYTAGAPAYQTPRVVKDWYAQSDTSSVQWDDNAVAGFFKQSTPPKTRFSSPNNDTSTPKSSTPNSSSNHTGAIVGGVVGGVAALCLLAALLFYFLRRRRRQQSQSPTPLEKDSADMSHTGSCVAELSSQERRFEAHDGNARGRWTCRGTVQTSPKWGKDERGRRYAQ